MATFQLEFVSPEKLLLSRPVEMASLPAAEGEMGVLPGHAPMIVFQLGGVVSANTGPDGIAIVYEGKPRNLEAYTPELP